MLVSERGKESLLKKTLSEALKGCQDAVVIDIPPPLCYSNPALKIAFQIPIPLPGNHTVTPWGNPTVTCSSVIEPVVRPPRVDLSIISAGWLCRLPIALDRHPYC